MSGELTKKEKEIQKIDENQGDKSEKMTNYEFLLIYPWRKSTKSLQKKQKNICQKSAEKWRNRI